MRKPGTAADATGTVRAIKSAGVHVGVIVITGLGGARFAGGHERDTAAVINAMGLGEGDLVYFSDLVEVPSASYPVMAAEAQITPLTGGERRRQRDRIRSGLRCRRPAPVRRLRHPRIHVLIAGSKTGNGDETATGPMPSDDRLFRLVQSAHD